LIRAVNVQPKLRPFPREYPGISRNHHPFSHLVPEDGNTKGMARPQPLGGHSAAISSTPGSNSAGLPRC
jgi:hypothetical protein